MSGKRSESLKFSLNEVEFQMDLTQQLIFNILS